MFENTRMRDFEIRVAQWRESYEEYQQLLAAFRQEQKGFAYQMHLHDEKHGDLKEKLEHPYPMIRIE